MQEGLVPISDGGCRVLPRTLHPAPHIHHLHTAVWQLPRDVRDVRRRKRCQLSDLSEHSVNFIENFDGSETEPTVLPCKIPHLFVNGSS